MASYHFLPPMLLLCEERANVQLKRQAIKRSLAQLITAPRIKGAITIELLSRQSVEVASPRHDLHPLCVSPWPRHAHEITSREIMEIRDQSAQPSDRGQKLENMEPLLKIWVLRSEDVWTFLLSPRPACWWTFEFCVCATVPRLSHLTLTLFPSLQ